MTQTEPTHTAAGRGRLPIQFSVRTLLIAFAVLSIPLGLFCGEMVRLRSQRAIARSVYLSGATLFYDYDVSGKTAGAETGMLKALLRRSFGDDVFADISAVRWDYTYQPVHGDSIEAAARLRSLREVSFMGPPSYSGRAPMPWETLPEEEQQQFADRQVQAFGQLHGCKRLERMFLYGCFTTDRHLAQMSGGGALKSLEVFSTRNVSDAGVRSISTYVHLEELRISDVPNVTDTGASQLDQILGLRLLDLSGTAITDVTLEHVAHLNLLERLMLNHCAITDSGVRSLSQLKHLKELELLGTKVGDDGLAALAAMDELETLDLSDTQISNAALELLQQLPALSTLRLTGTRVSDAGLMSLQHNTALRRVEVSISETLSRGGVRDLKALLPQCTFRCNRFDEASGQLILAAWE